MVGYVLSYGLIYSLALLGTLVREDRLVKPNCSTWNTKVQRSQVFHVEHPRAQRVFRRLSRTMRRLRSDSISG